MTSLAQLATIVDRYTADPESVYNTWFISSDERTKAFRSIRRGVRDTVTRIADGTFGNDFKGSELEFVLNAITEQKQVFEGAAHPFYWKPKLRIPDIYENRENQRRFGMFLDACLAATRDDVIVREMSRLAEPPIKGLGPAVANIVYFLHPTLVPPFNTAMVNGFNALFRDRQRLGSWTSYLAMRETIVRVNAEPEIRSKLSKDLGAFAGLLFEIGTGRLLIDGNIEAALADARTKAIKASRARHDDVVAEQREESEHTQMQHHLITIGRALGYDVFVARNDRHRRCSGESFSMLTIPQLPSREWPQEILDTVSLIDVIWLERGSGAIVAGFEVEKSTSIYSGILRMEDLARSIPGGVCHFYLVAPDRRERDVLAQLSRPAFRNDLDDISMSFIPFSELASQCEALCRFGEDHLIMQKIARSAPALSPGA
jgi:type II restriction enzyme